MAITGVRVEGLNRVVRGLQDVGVDVEDLKDAFSDIAKFGARAGARHAPKMSGRLSSDIRGNRAKNKAVVSAGRVSVPYAGPINYGWPARNIGPSGFMQAADRDTEPFALRRLERSINAAIKRRGLS